MINVYYNTFLMWNLGRSYYNTLNIDKLNKLINVMYRYPFTRWEHGSYSETLHRILYCAMVTIAFKLYPIFFTSTSKSRGQVLLCRPPFLFPYGFRVGVCLVMLDSGILKVWPIQIHFVVIFIFLQAVDLSRPTQCCCRSSSVCTLSRHSPLHLSPKVYMHNYSSFATRCVVTFVFAMFA